MSINKLSDSYATTYPFVYKSSWKLTKDDTATDKEIFTSIQVTFTGSTPIVVCVEPVEGTAINPVIIPFSGCIIPIVGRGFKSSGNDKNGNAFTTDAAVEEALGMGGI